MIGRYWTCVLEHEVETCMNLAPCADVVYVHEIGSFVHMECSWCFLISKYVGYVRVWAPDRIASRYSGTETLSVIIPVPLVAVWGREWGEQGKITF